MRFPMTTRVFSCCAVAVLTLSAGSAVRTAAAQAEPQVIEIHAKKFGYDPSEITLHKGQTYKLHLTSDDTTHSLRIKALNLNAVMKPKQFNDVLFTPEQVGDFKADCGVFCGVGHAKMAMMVHVVE